MHFIVGRYARVELEAKSMEEAKKKAKSIDFVDEGDYTDTIVCEENGDEEML